MNDLNNLIIFARVAETCSFSRAAEQLDLSASAVSKAISRLEEEMGIRLLHRTTRSVTPTNEGLEFLDRCRATLAEIEDAESSIRGVQGTPRGRLRLLMPVALGHRVIVPALRELAREHPDITLDCELTDRVPDIQYEGLDCAILIGNVSDQRVVARKLYGTRFYPCASPGYLEQHGEPKTPDDLDGHRCLGFVLSQSGKYRDWRFQRDGLLITKNVTGQLNLNHGQSLLEAAIAGEGIAMLSSFMIDDALRRGQLKLLLRDFATEGPPVWLLYPDRRMSAKVRLFVDLVTRLFSELPSWDRAIQDGKF